MNKKLGYWWRKKSVIRERVFGVGMKKTGTTSLKRCFERLDLNPIAPSSQFSLQTRLITRNLQVNNDYTMALDYAEKFKSFEDSPWNLWEMYQQLDHRFPDSLFILTKRDSDKWWRSVERWISVTKPWMFNGYLRHLRVKYCKKKEMIEAYDDYNKGVIQHFKDRTNLLVIDFEKNKGWEPICDFLNCPLPNQPFPHVNRQTYDEQDLTRRKKKMARRIKRRIENLYIRAILYFRKRCR